MKIQADGKGQPYIDVGNLRITLVHKDMRELGKDWAGSHVIRIQAYREDGGLYLGAEYPIPQGYKDVWALISAINNLIAEKL